MNKKHINIWVFGILSFIFIVGVIVSTYLIFSDKKPDIRGTFGDMFGGANALFTGLSFLGLIITILLQRKDFKESQYQYLHDRMTNFVYVQLDRCGKEVEKLELTEKGLTIRDNEALYFLYENLEPIYLAFAEIREQRLNIALNSKAAILKNLDIIKKSQSKLSTFIISTDNCFLTLDEILKSSKLTLHDQKDLRNIFLKNLGFMFPRIIERIYDTLYLMRMFRFELEIDSDNVSSLMTILNKIQYFHIFHHSKKYN